MSKRKIIQIDEKKCNGCGACIPDCPEGALQVIDGKARLISDLFCDGLGACIGSCPRDAIRVVEREAKPYNETKVMENIVRQGDNVIKAHLEHLKIHGEKRYLNEAVRYLENKGIKNPLEEKVHENLPCGCPGTMSKEINKKSYAKSSKARQESELTQWPVQLKLLPVHAPYFENADLLIAADCVPFAYANFHPDLLKGKKLLIGCPKLDDAEFYREKLQEIFKNNNIRSVTVAHMEVPCCYGIQSVVEEAIRGSGKKIPLKEYTISVDGKKI